MNFEETTCDIDGSLVTCIEVHGALMWIQQESDATDSIMIIPFRIKFTAKHHARIHPGLLHQLYSMLNIYCVSYSESMYVSM